MSDAEYDADTRFALAAAPLAQKVADAVRAMLPPDTHFGVFILTPPLEGQGRVIAVTTDRNVVGPQVAQWFPFNPTGEAVKVREKTCGPWDHTGRCGRCQRQGGCGLERPEPRQPCFRRTAPPRYDNTGHPDPNYLPGPDPRGFAHFVPRPRF